MENYEDIYWRTLHVCFLFQMYDSRSAFNDLSSKLICCFLTSWKIFNKQKSRQYKKSPCTIIRLGEMRLWRVWGLWWKAMANILICYIHCCHGMAEASITKTWINAKQNKKQQQQKSTQYNLSKTILSLTKTRKKITIELLWANKFPHSC